LKPTAEELKTILENHRKWVWGETGGSRANLGGADLRSADLRSADLRSADLRSADLRSADLRSANLGGANLGGADLRSADLRSADLRSANLGGANLGGANLYGANNFNFSILPAGTLIGWKKLQHGHIACLEIGADVKRVNTPVSRKCRAASAVVLSVEDANGNPVQSGVSMYDCNFVYRVGETVKPRNAFDEDARVECASGIHFFITKEEAKAY
jgi:uncharacterized protein YjbI with pentapeptide repeats